MSVFDRTIAAFAPQAALRRARARVALEALANYRAAGISQRSGSVRAAAGDADAVAMQSRRQMMLSARDVVRNKAVAERAVQVIVNNVVGTGIEPKLGGTVSDQVKALWPEWSQHLDSVAVDAEGVSTLAGIQRLAVRAMVVDGEALIVFPRSRDGSFQVRVLEADYLDDRLNGTASAAPGNVIFDGIEYDASNRPVAYHLYDDHPGSAVWRSDWRGLTSSRVDSARVIHLYRVDRPGQRRGVSWFAPVLEDLVALADSDEAQLLRMKIAACFAAFWRTSSDVDTGKIPTTLSPGLIQQIGMDDQVDFATPPDVGGYDEFSRLHLRRIAAGLGITYEALTGDLTGINFSSGRIGRIEMGQNVEAWQWALVIPRLCQPMAAWFMQAQAYANPRLIADLREARLDHTPPPPVITDPKGEIQAAVAKIEAGLSSRPAEIRRLGYEPAEIDKEIAADAEIRRGLAALKAPSVAAAAQDERNIDV